MFGEAGVGKTAIVEGLARLIVEGKVPEVLEDSVIYSLDLAACSRAPSTVATSRNG